MLYLILVEVARQYNTHVASAGVRFQELPLRTTTILRLYIQSSDRPIFTGTPSELYTQLVVSFRDFARYSYMYMLFICLLVRFRGPVYLRSIFPFGCTMPLYAANMDTRLPAGLPSYLGGASNNLHPLVNDNVGLLRGINRSAYYFSGRHAYLALHPEDGFAPSCNLMHWAIGDAFKVWDCRDTSRQFHRYRCIFGNPSPSCGKIGTI